METPGFFTKLIFGLLILSSQAFAADCGPIVVDCAAGRISISGLPSKGMCGEVDRIDCGLPTRNSPEGRPGRIGGKHHGTIVPDGVAIEGINGMGQSGGGKVFHTSNVWNDNSCPKRQTWGRGCITVGPEVIRRLRKCEGSQLTIVGAKGGTVSRGYAAKDRQELINQRNSRNSNAAPAVAPKVEIKTGLPSGKTEIKAEIEKPKAKWSGRAYQPDNAVTGTSGSF
jgi:hypothetical protein